MLLKRSLVTIILLPFGLAAIYFGGWVFAGLVALALGLAAFEYTRLFRAGGLQPSMALVVGGTLLLAAAREIDGFNSGPWMLSLLVLVSMAYHLVMYERGRDQAATDFTVTLGGILYLGWIGAYLISLRDLPEGVWWVLVALPAVWFADSGAYFIGSRFGRHKMTRRLSPKKSWEGYVGGIVFGTAGAALLAVLWGVWAGPATVVTPLRAAWLGLALSVLTTLGDLGESMIKRQAGMKDSGKLLPGHGGAFDRVDSWLWAGVISYYMIVWLFP